VLIIGIRQPLQESRSAETAGGTHRHEMFLTAIGSAFRFARGSRLVSAYLLSKTTFGVGTGVVLMLAVFGRDVFRAGDAGIGLLFAARGLGALIGPFLARSVITMDDRGLLRGIGVSFGVVVVCYALFPVAPTIWLAAPLVFGAHLGGGSQWTLSTYGLQRSTPDGIRGRIFSFDYGLVTMAIALSTLLAGFVAEALRPDLAVWVMVGLIAVAGTGWSLLSRRAMQDRIARRS
jgi:hypothetical protein